MLFRSRGIGLWSSKVQDAYARMGIVEFADVDVNELMARDDRIAQQMDAEVRQSA